MVEYKLRNRVLTACRWLSVALLGVISIHALPTQAAAPTSGPLGDPVSGLIIKLQPAGSGDIVAFSGPARAQILERELLAYGRALRYVRPLATGAELMAFDKPVSYSDALAMATELSRVRGVLYAAPNRTIRPQATPNDPLFSDPGQWGFKYVPGSIQGANFTAAWDISKGSSAQTIGIIDSGIAGFHVELEQQLRMSSSFPNGGFDFMTDPELSGDGDGRDFDPQQTDSGPSACGHGTHVAGTVAAVTSFAGTGLGVAGGAPHSKLLIGRAFQLFGADADAIDAMLWMSGESVSGVPLNPNLTRIINMSFGGLGGCGPAYQDAIDRLRTRGVLPVTAAGNSGVDVSQFAPANCRGTLAVAAIDVTGARASFTNYGARISVAAPGVSILSTGGTTSGACTKNGTSMAAPHVTAAAALMQSAVPALSVNQTMLGIKAGARPFVGGGCDTTLCGAGILDAYQSLVAVTSPAVRLGWNESSVTVRENDGYVTLTLTRIGSAASPASASIATISGTAQLGLDFSAASPPTVSWSANDSSDRVVTIPILYRPGEQGLREFSVALSDPGAGTSFVAPASIPVRITEVDCDTVTPIAMSETQTGTLNASTPAAYCHGGVRGPEYNTVRYSFSGTAGDTVWVSARSTTTAPAVLDTYIYLLNPDRTILAENDDITNTVVRDSAIQAVTLTTTGTHYIDITSWSATQDASGSYQVRLSNCGPYIAQAACNADADGDDRFNSKDAIYVVRRLLGVSDAALMSGVTPVACATRGTGSLASPFIDGQSSAPSGPIAYDLDGDGQVRAMTDGLMLLRVALGLTGDAVITGAAAAGAPRNTWALVKDYLRESCAIPLAP